MIFQIVTYQLISIDKYYQLIIDNYQARYPVSCCFVGQNCMQFLHHRVKTKQLIIRNNCRAAEKQNYAGLRGLQEVSSPTTCSKQGQLCDRVSSRFSISF